MYGLRSGYLRLPYLKQPIATLNDLDDYAVATNGATVIYEGSPNCYTYQGTRTQSKGFLKRIDAKVPPPQKKKKKKIAKNMAKVYLKIHEQFLVA